MNTDQPKPKFKPEPKYRYFGSITNWDIILLECNAFGFYLQSILHTHSRHLTFNIWAIRGESFHFHKTTELPKKRILESKNIIVGDDRTFQFCQSSWHGNNPFLLKTIKQDLFQTTKTKKNLQNINFLLKVREIVSFRG